MRNTLIFVLACALLLGLVACGSSAPPVTEAPAAALTDAPSAAPASSPPVITARPPVPRTGEDWLFADGRRIVDQDGNEVWITGLNWFGYNTNRLIFDGAWGMDIRDMVFQIADRGFNMIRVPLSMQLVRNWSRGNYPVYATVDDTLNPKFTEEGTLAYLDYFIDCCAEAGVKIMLDIHSVRDGIGAHGLEVWYDLGLSVEEFYQTLEFLAGRYRDDDTVVAFDLKNEPHGNPSAKYRAVWNDAEDETENWKYVAEQAAGRVLAVNPDILIVIEGIEAYPKDPAGNADYASMDAGDYHFTWWGGNLRGVRDFPVDLGDFQNKVVYSPHDYGPTVGMQPWFQGEYDYERLYTEAWYPNWLYIHEDDLAPLIIGEWGGPMREPNLKWMTLLRDMIIEQRVSHTFWCLNPNSGDTGGLLLADFKTWDETKYEFLKPALWQKDGRFVGLSANTPLGTQGMTRTEANGT